MPTDASAMKFGTLPAIPARTTAAGDVILEPNARSGARVVHQNIKTPFTFIAATTVVTVRPADHRSGNRIDLDRHGPARGGSP